MGTSLSQAFIAKAKVFMESRSCRCGHIGWASEWPLLGCFHHEISAKEGKEFLSFSVSGQLGLERKKPQGVSV